MFNLYQDILKYIFSHQDDFVKALKIHIAIFSTVMLVSIAIAIPLGIFCAKNITFSQFIMHVFNILKIIPSLAVLIAVMPILGTGFFPALLALSMHAVPTILINTYLGFQNIDKSVIESAKGMGLSGKEILLKVEFPLALPLMITGIRTCSVDVMASAALAAYIGAGGLGDFIVMGIGALNISVMMVGSLSVALLSVVVDFALSFLQRKITRYQTD